MTTQVFSARVRPGRRWRVRLWIPVIPVLVVLSPVLLLVAAAALVGGGVSPRRGLPALWRLLVAIRGLKLDIRCRRNVLYINFI